MENKEDDIEKLFKSHFSGDEAPVSPMVWENIKKTLPPESPIKNYGVSLNFLFWTLSLLLLNVTVTGIFLYAPQNTFSETKTILLSSHEIENPSIHNNDTSLSNAPLLPADNFSQAFSSHTKDTKTEKPSPITIEEKGLIVLSKSHKQKNIMATVKNNLYSETVTNKEPQTLVDKYTIESRNKLREEVSIATNPEQTTRRFSQLNSSTSLSEIKVSKNKDSLIPFQQTNLLHPNNAGGMENQGDLLHDMALNDMTISSQNSFDKNKNTDDSIQADSTAIQQQNVVESVNTSDSSIALLASHNKNHQEKEKEPSTENTTFLTPDSLVLFSNIIASDTVDKLVTIPTTDSLESIPDSLENKNDNNKLLQDTKEKKTKQSKNLRKNITLDLTMALFATGANTKSRVDDYAANVSNKKSNEKWRPGFAFGIMANYRLHERLTLSAGASYLSYSQQYNYHYNIKTYQSVLVDSNWQVIQVDSINKDIKATDQYQFVSVPLQLSFVVLSKEKITLSLMAGIRGNILIRGKTYLPTTNQSDVTEWNGFNKLSMAYSGGIELQYQLGSTLGLLVQPLFLYNATSVHNTASGIIQKPYALGLNIGLRFGF